MNEIDNLQKSAASPTSITHFEAHPMGACCAICFFRYFEHSSTHGDIIACPVCALTAETERVTERDLKIISICKNPETFASIYPEQCARFFADHNDPPNIPLEDIISELIRAAQAQECK